MGNRARHQQALIIAAARLMRRRGFAAASTGDILKASGAPRGSLYYYFPGGKEAVGAAALESAGAMVAKALGALAAKAASPAHFIDLYAGELTAWLEKSGYRDGCPLATTLLETAAESEAMAAAGRAAFNDWRQVIAAMLTDHAIAPAHAQPLAGTIIMMVEGALILARTERSPAPVNECAEALKELLSHAS